MQLMYDHKGEELAVMGKLLTGILSGGGISSAGDIVNLCFRSKRYNSVSRALHGNRYRKDHRN